MLFCQFKSATTFLYLKEPFFYDPSSDISFPAPPSPLDSPKENPGLERGGKVIWIEEAKKENGNPPEEKFMPRK